MPRGVVTKTSGAFAFVWTPDADSEILIDERKEAEADRLMLGEWLEFNLDRPSAYRRIDPALPCEVDSKGRLRVKTRIHFEPEKANEEVITEAMSVDFGRVGVFRRFQNISADCEYDAWVIRVPESVEQLGQAANVQWCLAKQTLVPAPKVTPSRANISSSPSSTGRSSQSNFYTGLVVSEFQQLLFVWSPALGEGMMHKCANNNFCVCDWLEFTIFGGKSFGGDKYEVGDARQIAPLYPAHHVRNTVEVEVEVTIPVDLTPLLTVDFFGEISDEVGILRRGRFRPGQRVTVHIERRRPRNIGDTIWAIKRLGAARKETPSNQPTSGMDNRVGVSDSRASSNAGNGVGRGPSTVSRAQNLSPTSPSFAMDALRAMLSDEGVRNAVLDFDPHFARTLEGFLASH